MLLASRAALLSLLIVALSATHAAADWCAPCRRHRRRRRLPPPPLESAHSPPRRRCISRSPPPAHRYLCDTLDPVAQIPQLPCPALPFSRRICDEGIFTVTGGEAEPAVAHAGQDIAFRVHGVLGAYCLMSLQLVCAGLAASESVGSGPQAFSGAA